MTKLITIISKIDDVSFQLDELAAKGSNLFENLLAEYDEDVLVIPGIKGEILGHIVEFLEYKKDNPCSELPRPIQKFDLKDILSEWEYIFLSRFDNKIYELFELINAVNYLDVRELFDLSCAKAACIVKDYNQEKFMEVFQIEPDMNDEDYKNLVKNFKINFAYEKEIFVDIDSLLEIEIEMDLTKQTGNTDQM